MVFIKQATNKDIIDIEEILADAVNFLEGMGQPLWERQSVTWAGLSKRFNIEDFYIASMKNEPVGCMALIDYDPSFWPDINKGESLFIHKLAVARRGAKQGVSKALLDFAKEQAVMRNINKVRLDVNQFRKKVRALYEKEGFVCVVEQFLFGEYPAAFYVWKADKPDSERKRS